MEHPITSLKITLTVFWSFFLTLIFKRNMNQAKKKNTLVSGNAGDEKNLHPGDRKFIFFQFN